MRRIFLAAAAALLLPAAMAGSSLPMAGVELKERIEVRPLPSQVVYKFSRNLRPGQIKVGRSASEGVERLVYSQVWVRGHLKGEHLVSRIASGGGTTEYLMGPAGFQASRGSGSFTRAAVMDVEATAYTPDAGLGAAATGITRTGRRARFGVIAVDPQVIPLHSLVFVEGYGFAVAADTGGAIKGRKIDICVMSNAEARQWGRRKVRIHVFKEKVPANVDQS